MTLYLPAGSLERAARASGLKVVVLKGAETRRSGGDFGPSCTRGVLCHHTGSYDALTDADNDLDYARWMGEQGRADLDPPLCNLALSAECVVYVVAYGNANHAGTARASGPMPAGDGNELYVGIEAMNSGAQGWGSVGTDAHGNPVTQGQAYARLCAALCREYRWPASHVRAHRETSLTGKWDPGLLDMDKHRAAVAQLITNPQEEDDMFTDNDRAMLKTAAKDSAAARAGSYKRDTIILDTLEAIADGGQDVKARVTKAKRELADLIRAEDAERAAAVQQVAAEAAVDGAA